MQRKWGQKSWFRYHRAKAEEDAFQRVAHVVSDLTDGPRRRLQLLERALDEVLKREPVWSKIIGGLGIPTRYERETVRPLRLEITNAAAALGNAERQARDIDQQAKLSGRREFLARHAQRQVEREQRREAARLRYLQRAPNLRSAQRALRLRLIDQAMDENGALRCFYCEIEVSELGIHIDHKTPIKRGGTNKLDNLVLACARCNLAKGTKTAFEFLRHLKAVAIHR